MGRDCSVLLRRKDMRPEPRFARYFGHRVDPDVLARFLPHWKALQWKGAPPSLLSRCEWLAVDGDFQISLEAGPDAKDHAIQMFERFMQG